MKNIDNIEKIVKTMLEDVNKGAKWQNRPKGGQQTGHSSSSFCNTNVGGLISIRRYCKWILEEVNEARDAKKV